MGFSGFPGERSSIGGERREMGDGVSSESGFAGLWDFQDSPGERMSTCGEKREMGGVKS